MLRQHAREQCQGERKNRPDTSQRETNDQEPRKARLDENDNAGGEQPNGKPESAQPRKHEVTPGSLARHEKGKSKSRNPEQRS